MGRIKSALEIALERTEAVKGDKSAVEQFDAKQRGKKAAHDFLEGTGAGVDNLLGQTEESQRASFRRGLFEALLAQVTLPVTAEDTAKTERAGRGLEALLGSRFGALFRQFTQMLARYLSESAGCEEAVIKQYAPKLRQKEEELSRRMGTQVRLDPFQDPEFLAFYNQSIASFKASYEAACAQVRAEAERLFEGE
ncbi:MAG: hypothetical protein MdMp014T_0969 [Treponematales bacterium]